MKSFLQLFSVSLILIIVPGFLIAQVPLNWTRDEINPGEDFSLAPDESFKTEGMKSLHMRLNSGAVPYLVSDVFYITPGAEYDFSIDVFDNDTSGQIKVYADFYDTYGFNIFGQPPVYSADSSEWQAMNWSGMIPTQAVVGYILVKFYCQPDLYHFVKEADVWIDNVQFIQEGGINMVANGGFEEWNVGYEESGNELEALFVYPNPAKDFLNIDLPGNLEEIIITDFSGRDVFKTGISEKTQIRLDISCWHEGLYYIRAILKDGNFIIRKLIVL